MNTDRVYAALDGIRTALPALEDALIPGTPRRWTQHDISDEQRARMDALARAERDAKAENLARGIKSLGDGRAPLSLDVLDVMADIAVSVADLEDATCDRLGLTRLAGASTAARLTRLIGLLNRVESHPDLSEHVEDEACRMHRQVRRALGESEPVHRIDARCPICSARSLRVFADRELICCVNAACRCSNQPCGCNAEHPRRHRWPLTDWDNLAATLEVAS